MCKKRKGRIKVMDQDKEQGQVQGDVQEDTKDQREIGHAKGAELTAIERYNEDMIKIKSAAMSDYQKAQYLSKIRQGYMYPDQNIRINYLVSEINTHVRILKREPFIIGMLLCEVKQLVGHGSFKKYIAATFDFSYETANNFMNVYYRCLGCPEIVDMLKVSTLYKICDRNFPEKLRQAVFEEVKASKLEITDSGVNSLIDRYKNGTIDIDNPKLEKLFPLVNLTDKLAVYLRHLNSCYNEVNKWSGIFEKLNKTLTLEFGEDPIKLEEENDPWVALRKCLVELHEIREHMLRQKYSVLDNIGKEFITKETSEQPETLPG